MCAHALYSDMRIPMFIVIHLSVTIYIYTRVGYQVGRGVEWYWNFLPVRDFPTLSNSKPQYQFTHIQCFAHLTIPQEKRELTSYVSYHSFIHGYNIHLYETLITISRQLVFEGDQHHSACMLMWPFLYSQLFAILDSRIYTFRLYIYACMHMQSYNTASNNVSLL